jgi:hypothetical protein
MNLAAVNDGGHFLRKAFIFANEALTAVKALVASR